MRIVAGRFRHPDHRFEWTRQEFQDWAKAMAMICEQKHMGSRAVIIVCRDEDAAKMRFGIAENEIGIVYTRTGRRFFNEPALERQFLERVRAALTASDFWGTFKTSWACLDCELMPWSAKAQELLRTQYAAVGAAGRASLPCAVMALAQAITRLTNGEKEKLEQVKDAYHGREGNVGKFVAAYRQYCWPVSALTDLKLAPFHLLATEGHVHVAKDHDWHMQELGRICGFDPEMLLATPYKIVDVTDPSNEAEGIDWWIELTQ